MLSAASYGFEEPVAAAVSGPNLFVANYDGSSVTELDASTGALVRVFLRRRNTTSSAPMPWRSTGATFRR